MNIKLYRTESQLKLIILKIICSFKSSTNEWKIFPFLLIYHKIEETNVGTILQELILFFP